MRKLMQKMLASIARKLIKKYKPVVIGITGSVGKTSAKNAAAVVIKKSYSVRATQKSQNNEFGLPMTVIGTTAIRSKAGWVFLVLHGVRHLLFKSKHFPQVLVLEMGADHPGDLDYLMSIAPPTISVITGISAAHTEFFKNVNGVLKEKKKLALKLPPQGTAILNADDELVMSIKNEIACRVLTYGTHSGADICIDDIGVLYGEDGFPNGMRFKVHWEGKMVPMKVQGVLGEAAVSSIIAGIATGLALGMHLVDIAKGLDDYTPPAGRMRLISGIKKSILLDDSYNSSPKAALAALRAFESVEVSGSGEKWIALGDMRELGELSEDAHREVGHQVALSNPDYLVVVGELGKEIAHAAIEAGMPQDRVYEFAQSKDAGVFIQEKLEPRSAVLVKGSQAVRMERITKELMADPLSAPRLLVRQEKRWLQV